MAISFLRYFLNSFWLALYVFCAQNCGRDRDIRFAEIIAFDENAPREVTLRIVRFETEPSLPSLSNDKMTFVTGARLMQHLIGQWAIVTSGFAELADKLHVSMDYKPFALDVSTESGIAKGRSFESVLALTAYSHLERIFSFTESFNGPFLFKRPLNVAIYGEILAPDGHSQPVSKNDNALYVGSADTIFLLPLGKEQGLPLTMHEGVLAHEFHHRIFFNTIWDNRAYKNLWSLYQSRYDLDETRISKRSRVLLNALDEGLADTFAVAFTGIPDYLNISLTQNSSDGLRRQRDLHGAFAETATYDLLATSSMPARFADLCGENANDFENQKFNAYCLGTVIAKTLFDASSGSAIGLRNNFLPLLVPALSAVASALDRGRQFDLDIFWDELSRLAKISSPVLGDRLCAAVKKRFATIATDERMPSCI